MIEQISNESEIENLYKTGHNSPYTKLPEKFFGYVGVLLMHKDTGLVQCHICGKWVKIIGPHVWKAHKISGKQYRKTFGFSSRFPLCSKKFSEQRRQTCLSQNLIEKAREGMPNTKAFFKARAAMRTKNMAAASQLNKLNICREQLLRRVHVVADLVGHFPSQEELKEHDGAALATVYRRYGSWNKFKAKETQEALRIIPKSYTKDKLLFVLSNFPKKMGRLPTSRDFHGKKGNPSKDTYIRHFGSWNRAMSMAGLLRKL